jgi:hypothetical protein
MAITNIYKLKLKKGLHIYHWVLVGPSCKFPEVIGVLLTPGQQGQLFLRVGFYLYFNPAQP